MFLPRGWGLLASVGCVALLWGAPASSQLSLGTADSFSVLAGSTVTNTGGTVIAGDLGVSPGSSVTGFPPGVVAPPSTIHAADALAAQAQADVTAADIAITGIPAVIDLTGTNLGGLTLTPNVYNFSSSAQLSGPLTLDAQGNPNAVFIFKIGSSLTTTTGSSVLMINGGSTCNVYWQVGSSATFGTATAFVGNVLALTSITFGTGASTSGRALARNGAVTLNGNSVAECGPLSACPVITLSPAALQPGEVGVAYSQTLTASGSAALPYTYSVSTGSLPAGLSLNPGTGAITGTPTTAGTYDFRITATDANGCTGSQLYSVVVAGAGCPSITLSPSTLPSGSLGVAYSQTVSASGGTAPYAYAVSSGALPAGWSLNAVTGAITGTSTAAGPFSFVITATDANGCAGSRLYSIVIAPAGCPSITLSPSTLPSGSLGVAYSQTVTASGGTAPYTYAVTSGTLPPGRSLNAVTGAITGTSTAAGPFSFVITATDANGCSGSRPYSIMIAVAGCPSLMLSPSTLPGGSLGVAYSQTVSASGSTPPYVYAVSSGALPPGLSLNTVTGAITGTPTATGYFSFVITATDSGGCPISQAYTMSMAGTTVTPIPTLSEWGMILFMSLLGFAAIHLLRSRKPVRTAAANVEALEKL